VKRSLARSKTFLTIAYRPVQRFDVTHRPEPVEGECVHLLELARRRGLLEDARRSKLKDDLEEIARMLSGLISGLDRRST
jgi:hypothetical protein